MTNQFIALIGIDEEGKRRGGKFKSKDLAAVEKAASVMKLHMANPKTPEAAKLVASLPAGHLLANGVASVPLFKRKADPLWETFFPQPETKQTAPSQPPQPVLWPDLVKGSICLAPEVMPSENGFWKTEVIAVSADKKLLTLRWLDNPRQAPTTMPREQVALLHPRFL